MRVRGEDHSGVLDIKKATDHQRRLYQFREGYHSASGFLYEHSGIASKYFGAKPRNENDLYKMLGNLRFKVLCPVQKNKLEERERTILFAYIRTYGEPPPLNLNLPKRWEKIPGGFDMRRASAGLNSSSSR